jgi:hypothetical protein
MSNPPLRWGLATPDVSQRHPTTNHGPVVLTRAYQSDRTSRTACRTATHPADHTPQQSTQMQNHVGTIRRFRGTERRSCPLPDHAEAEAASPERRANELGSRPGRCAAGVVLVTSRAVRDGRTPRSHKSAALRQVIECRVDPRG